MTDKDCKMDSQNTASGTDIDCEVTKTPDIPASLFEKGNYFARLGGLAVKQGNIEEAHHLLTKAAQNLKKCIEVLPENDARKNVAFAEGQEICEILSMIEGVLNLKNLEETSTPDAVKPSQIVETPSAVNAKGDVYRRTFMAKIEEEGRLQKATFADITGFDEIKKEITSTILTPRKLAKLIDMGELIGSVVFFGPPGTGKTFFCEAVASALKYNLLKVEGSDIADEYFGNNVLKLKATFDAARACAPCIMFFDEMEGMFPERSRTRSEATKEQVTEFLVQCNETFRYNKENSSKEIFLMGATNHPDRVDAAVWRRMKKYIHVGLPSDDEKKSILSKMLGSRAISLLTDLHWKIILTYTTGFTAADLACLSQDIATVPAMKAMEASHFKQVQQQASENNEKLTMEKTVWTPCRANDFDAVKKSFEDFNFATETVQLQSITPVDIIAKANSRQPSLNIGSEDGPVKQCEKYNEIWGAKLQDARSKLYETEIDYSTSKLEEIYKDAKTVADQRKEKNDDKTAAEKLSKAVTSKQLRYAVWDEMKGSWIVPVPVHENNKLAWKSNSNTEKETVNNCDSVTGILPNIEQEGSANAHNRVVKRWKVAAGILMRRICMFLCCIELQ